MNQKKEVLKDEDIEIIEPDKPKMFRVPSVDVNEVVDGAKDVAENTAKFVGDAANAATDFAQDTLKQAADVFGKVVKRLDDTNRQQQFDKDRPVFLSDLEEGFAYPKMIRVVEKDRRKKSYPDSIGYWQEVKGTDLMNVYQKDFASVDNVRFYPKLEDSVYYVHPLDDHLYIEITEYFTYLKEQRVAELKRIAQELGAKHFKVQIMEERLSSNKSKTGAGIHFGFLGQKAGPKVEKEKSEKNYEYLGIIAEATYVGKEPKEPSLELWASNESIKSLVRQRLFDENPLQSETFRLDYNTSSGIKENEAAKIDGVLKGIKFNTTGSILDEAKKESKKRFEYTIEF